VLVDGKPQPIRTLQSLPREPLALEVLIDARMLEVDGPRGGRALAKSFLDQAFKLGRQRASVALIGRSATVLQPATDNLAALNAAIDGIATQPAGAEAGLYDAILLAATRLSAAPGRRAIYLITRGRSSSTTAQFNRTIQTLQQNHIPLYVAYGPEPSGQNVIADPLDPSRERLERVARESGGLLPAGLQPTWFWGYALTFPSNLTNREEVLRKTKVEVVLTDNQGRRPDLRVRISDFYPGR
jgi:hypothetical protein